MLECGVVVERGRRSVSSAKARYEGHWHWCKSIVCSGITNRAKSRFTKVKGVSWEGSFYD